MEQYRFALEEDWQTYLDKNGYVVVKAVASAEEVATARDLFWRYFEETKRVLRHDIETWENWRTDRRGIITDGGVIQCAGAWYVRGLPKVKCVFQKIWNNDDLIVSMDSLLLWKPWWINPAWIPITEGLHIDQNPFQKPNKMCVQGMVALYDVTDETGGLEVVPRSHTPEHQEKIRQACPSLNNIGDFCMIRDKTLVTNRLLLHAEAGDIILWDSRTIHGGKVGKGCKTTKENPVLPRMSMTVCMLPRSTATEDVLTGRREGFLKGYGFTHWPNKVKVITGRAGASYTPIQLSPEQDALL